MKTGLIVLCLVLLSCKENRFPSEGGQPSETLDLERIIPFQATIEGLGQLKPLRVEISVSDQEVHLELFGDSESLHEMTLQLDQARLGAALAKLDDDDLDSEKNPPVRPPENGIKYTLQTRLGTATFFQSAPEMRPQSPGRFEDLWTLINEWNEHATTEWQKILSAKLTRERKVVEEIADFLRRGMTRKQILSRFPEPDTNGPEMLIYHNWRADLVRNAGRKGVHTITIILENGVVTGWSIMSK